MGDGPGLSDSVDAEEVLASVAQHELPEAVDPVLETYDEIVGDRERTFWRWLDDLFPAFTLSTVAPEYREDIQVAKLLVSIFITVLDDVAERHDDRATFAAAASVPFDRGSRGDTEGADREIVAFTEDVWNRFTARNAGPRAREFKAIMRFDLHQVIDAIDYSYLINHQLQLLAEQELWVHDIHNMAVFVYADIDLAHSPEFDARELSALRPVIHHTERIARICNWIGTWERELHEGDCSSGVIAYALDAGIISLDELRAIRTSPSDENVRPVIETIRDHEVERIFERRLEEEFAAAADRGERVSSVDIGAYLDGFTAVRRYHNVLKDIR